ncbi:MAG: hypothetical protein IH599_04865, partial [Bacteroidales bacterium]|nr:hypothetical protein [Bacteroidales bacterium]
SFLKVFITHPLPENEELQGILMDCSFRYLNHPQEPIAVKAYCMDILYQFTGLYPEIANELILTLEGLVERDSSALCARGSVLLKYLRTMNPQ